MKFDVSETSITGVYVLRRLPFTDDRGTFERLFDRSELRDLLSGEIAQVNLSTSTQAGAIRGLHLQLTPHDETKVIACIRGRIFDVAVDLRADSAAFGKHVSLELDDQDPVSLLIPPGVAHGFQALVPQTSVLYASTSPYRPDFETGVRPFDPDIDIKWPLPCTSMSAKDRSWPATLDTFRALDRRA
jgi:dTDP-4-dehydrorhamnose 3,5-epimerase